MVRCWYISHESLSNHWKIISSLDTDELNKVTGVVYYRVTSSLVIVVLQLRMSWCPFLHYVFVYDHWINLELQIGNRSILTTIEMRWIIFHENTITNEKIRLESINQHWRTTKNSWGSSTENINIQMKKFDLLCEGKDTLKFEVRMISGYESRWFQETSWSFLQESIIDFFFTKKSKELFFYDSFKMMLHTPLLSAGLSMIQLSIDNPPIITENVYTEMIIKLKSTSFLIWSYRPLRNWHLPKKSGSSNI